MTSCKISTLQKHRLIIGIHIFINIVSITIKRLKFNFKFNYMCTILFLVYVPYMYYNTRF